MTERLSKDELRRIEAAATARMSSRGPGPIMTGTVPENVRADIGRYLVLEVAETMLRLVREVRWLRAELSNRTPTGPIRRGAMLGDRTPPAGWDRTPPPGGGR